MNVKKTTFHQLDMLLVQEEPELITYPRAGASHLPPSSFSRTSNERGADAWPEPRPPLLTSPVATGSPSFMQVGVDKSPADEVMLA